MQNTHLGLMLAGITSLLAVAMAALTMNAGFRFRHPRNPDLRVIDINGRLVVMPDEDEQRAKAEAEARRLFPVAIVNETEHDFGVLPPHISVTHKFIVRNAGEGPLELTKGETSCKCTFAGVTRGLIPPGEEGEIELTWNTGRINSYRQTATIKTNDPKNPRIRLSVRGEIDIQTAIEPSNLQIERLEPGAYGVSRFLAYSRSWKHFDVENLRCTIDGAALETEPASPELLREKGAMSGHWVKVTLPAMEPGYFNGAIRGELVANSDEPGEPFNVQIGGRVLRRLSIYGAAIDGDGVVTLGVTTIGEVKSAGPLFMKVKDAVLDIPVKRIEVDPPHLNVRVDRTSKSDSHGLYSLVVETAESAPASSHLGHRHGTLRIEFDHPRIRELELQVRFAILAERG